MDLMSIFVDNKLSDFIGKDVNSFIHKKSQFDVVLDNGKESKILVSEAYELRSYFDTIDKAKLNLVDTLYSISLDQSYILPTIKLEVLFLGLQTHNLEYSIEDVPDTDFKNILLKKNINILFDTKSELVWSVECGTT